MKRIITSTLKGCLCLALSVGSVAVAQQPQLPERPNLDNQLAYQRAIEAVIWSMPAISIREFQEAAFKDYGITWNDVVLFSKPAIPKQELLTANNQVPYILTCLNLRQGPVVVEIPAAGAKAVLFGSFVLGEAVSRCDLADRPAQIREDRRTCERRTRGHRAVLSAPMLVSAAPPGRDRGSSQAADGRAPRRCSRDGTGPHAPGNACAARP